MPHPPRTPFRRAVTLLAAVVLLGVGASAAGTPSAAQQRLQANEAALQSLGAQLALARTHARALAGASLQANLARQHRLELRKERLLDRAVALQRAADHARRTARIERRRAAAASATRAASPAAIPAVPVAPAVAVETRDDAALAQAIDGHLASKLSPLVGMGAAFVRSSRAQGLDPRVLVAIAGAETAFATYRPSQEIRNPFGMGPGIVYPSWEAAIDAAARNLGGSLYRGDGRITLTAIQARWAPHGAANDPTGLNHNWTRNVGHYLRELGGDPAAPVFTTAAATVTTSRATAAPAATARPQARERPARAADAPAQAARTTGRRARLMGRVIDPPEHRAPIIDGATFGADGPTAP